MNRATKLSLGIAAAILLLFALLFASVLVGRQPTSGAKIGAYPHPRAALVVIDIQEDYTGPEAKEAYRQGDKIIAYTNAAIDEAQRHGVPVVFIKNVIDDPIVSFLASGINAPGAPGTEMDRRLKTVPGTRTFSKTRSDAFSNPSSTPTCGRTGSTRCTFSGWTRPTA